MQRVVWFGIGSLVVSATVLGAMKLAHSDEPIAVPRVAASPVVAMPVVSAAPKVAPDLAAMLKELGTRVLRENTAAYPAIGAGEPYPVPAGSDEAPQGKLFAVGACERPTDAERLAITKRVSAAVHAGVWLSFGCKDRGGIVVDAAFDIEHPRKDGGVDREGHWKILRVTDKKITTLATLTGESEQDWMEWANEQTVSTWALVDLDGDGIHDIVSARTQHEGGSSTTDLDLDLRRSSDNKVVKLGSFGGLRDFGIARGSASTLVLTTTIGWDEHGREGTAQFSCIEATGLTECRVAAEAARIARATEIATWFVEGHAYEPADQPLPDRDQLARLLDVVNVTGDERARLLAAAAETPEPYRIKRELVANLAVRAALPETRPAHLAALLGDTACTKCEYKVVTSTTQLPEQRLQRTDRLFYKGTQLASITVRGPSVECSACGYEPPGQQFEIKTYRHGASSVALVYRGNHADEVDPVIIEKRASTLSDGTLYVFVDGELVAQHLGDLGPWYAFDTFEPNSTTTDLASIELDHTVLVHWPDIPDAASRYIADESARTAAQRRLESFDVTQWADPAYRALVNSDRRLVGI